MGMGFKVAEGPEVETDWYNFEALNMPAGPPGPGHVGHLLPRPGRARDGGAAHPHLAGPDPPDGGAARRPSTPSCRAGATGATPPTPATWPSSTRSRGWSSTGASPSATWPGRSRPSPAPTSAPRSTPGCARPTSPSPSRRPSSRSPAPSAGARAAGPARARAGSSSAAAAWSTRRSSRRWASTRPSGRGFAFGFGIDRCAQMRHGIADMRVLIENDVRFLRQF